MAEKRCYTVKELQEILGVSRPTVYNLLKKNEFRWIQLDGGKYRISKKSFDDWLDKLPEDFILIFKIDILNFFEKMRYGMGRRRKTS